MRREREYYYYYYLLSERRRKEEKRVKMRISYYLEYFVFFCIIDLF